MPKSETMSIEEDPGAKGEDAVAETTATTTATGENTNGNDPQEQQLEQPPRTEQEPQQKQSATTDTGDKVAPSPKEFVNNGECVHVCGNHGTRHRLFRLPFLGRCWFFFFSIL